MAAPTRSCCGWAWQYLVIQLALAARALASFSPLRSRATWSFCMSFSCFMSALMRLSHLDSHACRSVFHSCFAPAATVASAWSLTLLSCCGAASSWKDEAFCTSPGADASACSCWCCCPASFCAWCSTCCTCADTTAAVALAAAAAGGGASTVALTTATTATVAFCAAAAAAAATGAAAAATVRFCATWTSCGATATKTCSGTKLKELSACCSEAERWLIAASCFESTLTASWSPAVTALSSLMSALSWWPLTLASWLRPNLRRASSAALHAAELLSLHAATRPAVRPRAASSCDVTSSAASSAETPAP
mmetsp:Transcript_33658/g.79961  ORF Transcript_33658/g.79961 Transcript_33658/m.79961 type:complete len:309 (-) Transcript_33658:212-1138(-)